MLHICGVPASKFRPICSAIDKLDKEPWAAVREEMVEEKGLDPEAADRIQPFVELHGSPLELLRRLTEAEKERWFGENEDAVAALRDLGLLFRYLDALGWMDRISFDLSLARGLDYYTGVIYEAVLVDGTSQVGSIAAGGRYDNLVGMFSNNEVPCVGISIGIERVFAIMERRLREEGRLRAQPVDVLVSSVGKGLLQRRMEVAASLWRAGVAAEYTYAEDVKLAKQLPYAVDRGIPLVIIFGEDELAAGTVKIKDMRGGEDERHEVTVGSDQLCSEVKSLLAAGDHK